MKKRFVGGNMPRKPNGKTAAQNVVATRLEPEDFDAFLKLVHMKNAISPSRFLRNLIQREIRGGKMASDN